MAFGGVARFSATNTLWGRTCGIPAQPTPSMMVEQHSNRSQVLPAGSLAAWHSPKIWRQQRTEIALEDGAQFGGWLGEIIPTTGNLLVPGFSMRVICPDWLFGVEGLKMMEV